LGSVVTAAALPESSDVLIRLPLAKANRFVFWAPSVMRSTTRRVAPPTSGKASTAVAASSPFPIDVDPPRATALTLVLRAPTEPELKSTMRAPGAPVTHDVPWSKKTIPTWSAGDVMRPAVSVVRSVFHMSRNWLVAVLSLSSREVPPPSVEDMLPERSSTRAASRPTRPLVNSGAGAVTVATGPSLGGIGR
jgi:hypothetical protein